MLGDLTTTTAMGQNVLQDKLLAGKRALVTGAASGIGAAIVARFQAEGALVAGLDRSPGMTTDFNLVVDLRQKTSVAAAMEGMQQRWGMPDILVHAAAMTALGGVLETDPDRYAEIYDVNVISVVRLLQHCVPSMRSKGGGSIVLLSSINADFATPTQAAYAASKAALNSLTKTAALELARHGIRVNAVSPASIDTPLLRSGLAAGQDPEAAVAENMQRHPISRFGTPEEVAELVLFLASEKSAWITGSINRIDGGASVTRR